MTPKTLLSILSIVLFNFILLSGVHAVDAAKVAKNKQNTLGLYLTSTEASAYMKEQGKQALFIDIRDPVEIHTVGMPAGVDTNVPFKFINTKKWDAKKNKFKLDSNKDYMKDVEAALKSKGLGKGDRIILICGSGKRAAKAVNAMAKAGYKNVFSVVDGYKGWQANKLPWSKKLDRNKIYGNPS